MKSVSLEAGPIDRPTMGRDRGQASDPAASAESRRPSWTSVDPVVLLSVDVSFSSLKTACDAILLLFVAVHVWICVVTTRDKCRWIIPRSAVRTSVRWNEPRACHTSLDLRS
jgi:hypothetical protein